MNEPINLLPWQQDHVHQKNARYLKISAYLIALTMTLSLLGYFALCWRIEQTRTIVHALNQQLSHLQPRMQPYQQAKASARQDLQNKQTLTLIQQHNQQFTCTLQRAINALTPKVSWQEWLMTPTNITLSATGTSETAIDAWLTPWTQAVQWQVTHENLQPSHDFPGEIHLELTLTPGKPE